MKSFKLTLLGVLIAFNVFSYSQTTLTHNEIAFKLNVFKSNVGEESWINYQNKGLEKITFIKLKKGKFL